MTVTRAAIRAEIGGVHRSTATQALDGFVVTQLVDNGMDELAAKINVLTLRLKLLEATAVQQHEDNDKQRKHIAKRLQRSLAAACRLLRRHRQQMSTCISVVQQEVDAAAARARKKRVKPMELPTPDVAGFTYTEQVITHFGVLPSTMEENALEVGWHVAAKIARSHELWILAKVKQYDGRSGLYQVEDMDTGDESDEEHKEGEVKGRLHWVERRRVVELPADVLEEYEWLQFEKGQKVLAMYPDTTSFYRGVVQMPNPKGAPWVVLKFDDDVEEFTKAPDRKVPFRFVAPLKPWLEST